MVPSWPLTALEFALKNFLIRNVPLEYNLVQILWKAIWQSQIFLNVHIFFYSTILRIYLVDNLVHVHKDICTRMFPEALFVIERN